MTYFGVGSDPKSVEVLTKLGAICTQWNHLVALMRFLVGHLFNEGDKADIITAHMRDVQLNDLLQILCNEYVEPPLREHVDHFVQLFDRARVPKLSRARRDVRCRKRRRSSSLHSRFARSKTLGHSPKCA